MGARRIYPAQRFHHLLRTELRRVRYYHLGQAGFRELTVLVPNFVEQPHVLDRDHRLVTKVWSNAIRLSVNGLTTVRCKWMMPIGTLFTQQGKLAEAA